MCVLSRHRGRRNCCFLRLLQPAKHSRDTLQRVHDFDSSLFSAAQDMLAPQNTLAFRFVLQCETRRSCVSHMFWRELIIQYCCSDFLCAMIRCFLAAAIKRCVLLPTATVFGAARVLHNARDSTCRWAETILCLLQHVISLLTRWVHGLPRGLPRDLPCGLVMVHLSGI